MEHSYDFEITLSQARGIRRVNKGQMDLEARAVCMATETLLPCELRVCFRRVTHDGAGHVRLDIR